MTSPIQCDECRAIILELRDALVGAPLSRERRAELQAHSEAFSRMLRGSEEAADELFAKYSFRPKPPELLESPLFRNPRAKQALRKMLEHAVRTGHSVWALTRDLR